MTLTKEEYNQLEMETSNERKVRPASDDIQDLMRMAFDMVDEKWFKELKEEYNSLKAVEVLVRAELGVIG